MNSACYASVSGWSGVVSPPPPGVGGNSSRGGEGGGGLDKGGQGTARKQRLSTFWHGFRSFSWCVEVLTGCKMCGRMLRRGGGGELPDPTLSSIQQTSEDMQMPHDAL